MDILEKYGINEVADVTLYELDDYGEIATPVLFLDTLKISSIEISSEKVNHYGGIANKPLISWENSQDIIINLEDALFSKKALAIMLGGKLDKETGLILKTEIFRATKTRLPSEGNSSSGWKSHFQHKGNRYLKINPSFYNSNGEEIKELVIGEKYFCSYYLEGDLNIINITETGFPKYYCLIGETAIRNENTMQDEIFYFVVPKVKMSSNLTFNLSADSDYSVFNTTFNALKYRNLNLIEIIQAKFFEDIVIDIPDLDNLAVLGKAVLGKLILGKGG